MHIRVLRRIALVALGSFFMASPSLADTVGSVTVHLTRNGAAASGRPVTISGDDGSRRSATTDGSGDARFPRLGFGHYTIAADDARRAVDLASGSVARVAIDLGLATIGRGTVTPARGPGGDPVSVTTIGRAQIAALPQNQSLNRLIETLPGIARFSYDEPVAHGFHGITYELDGVPYPQGTTSDFGEVVDPRTIDSLEVFTGAFPAEFGGSRQGAVVNLVSGHGAAPVLGESGRFTIGGGSYGGAQSSLSDAFRSGATDVAVSANLERTSRGIDSPTFVPDHDDASRANAFLRLSAPLGGTNSLAIDLAGGADTFAIPRSTIASGSDPVRSAPGTDDVQLEQNRFASAVFTHETRDGRGYIRVAPWIRSDRVAYLGDLGADLAGTFTDPGSGTVTPLDGLREDRRSTFAGLRVDAFRTLGRHAVKAGVDVSQERFSGTTTIAQATAANFADDVAARGSQSAAYIEDTWTPVTALAVKGGVRFDRSTGFVGGGQISPRLEVDFSVGPRDIVHAYYGRTYAAPSLEDTRREAIVSAGGSATDALPAYDLQPEKDSSYEFGVAHTFAERTRGTLNFWKRDVTNVLDTTQIFPTPVFAVYNNTIGIAKGVEGHLESRWRGGDFLTVSASLSSSRAGGISGGTFLFAPGTTGDVTLSPEDHDQTFAATVAYVKRFGLGRTSFASLSPQYGTGYPVQFQNGAARLPPHLTVDASVGRDPVGRAAGLTANFENFTNARYLIKVDNGFNTTQYGSGARFTLRLSRLF